MLHFLDFNSHRPMQDSKGWMPTYELRNQIKVNINSKNYVLGHNLEK